MDTPSGRWTAVGSRGIELMAGSTVTLTFAEGRVSAHAGCNRMSAQGGFDGDVLRLTGPLMSTMMLCQGVMEQERWLTALLEAGPRWSLAAGTLELTSGADTLSLTQPAADPEPEPVVG